MLKILLYVPLWIIHRIEDLVEVIADEAKVIGDEPLVRAALEADLGLPPDSLKNLKVDQLPDVTPEIRAYLKAASPSGEDLKTTFEAIAAYFKFWTELFKAAETEDPSIVADELLYRLVQTTTTDLIKFEYPTVYALMRFFGVIEQDMRLAVEEVFAPEVGANLFRKSYWDGWLERFEDNYLRWRLEQQPDILPPNATPSVRDRQLGLRVFGLSDLGMGLIAYLSTRFKGTDFYYGWEIVPRPPAPLCGTQPGRVIALADHVASRTATVRIARGPLELTLSQLLFEEATGRLGWLVSLSGSFAVEQEFGPASRPIKVKATVDAHEGVSAVLRFSGASTFQGSAPSSGLALEIAPSQTTNQAPPFAIPGPGGTRLEIGDFLIKGALNDDEAKLRVELRRTALVIVSHDSDPVTKKLIPSGETRIDFVLGLTLDSENGLSFDGGSRLSTTIAVNKAIAGLRVQTVSVGLTPDAAEADHSELRLEATTAFTLSIGGFTLAVEGIGANVAFGTTKGEVPEGSARLMGNFLYVGDAGFVAPKGIGIAIDGWGIKGGGYLFYDPDRGQYAGALQLAFGERFSLTAIGLLTAGDATGFSLLAIASLEIAPALTVPPGIAFRGIGVLIGLNRGINADALRAGVRNKTLDAILFPQDVVANAARYVSTLATVFPPERDRNVFGVTLSVEFFEFIGIEVGLVKSADLWVLMGQIHIALPRKSPVKVLDVHADFVGLWDTGRGEFSLDGTIYDSHLGPVKFSGDIAVRSRKGDDAYFLFSAGGYHPEFNVPAGFPALRRLTISLADSENLRIKLTGYLAFTSNTRQIGARLELFVKIGSVSIEGILGFDALWQADDTFVVIFDIEFKLKYKGTTFFGVEVSGRLTGPHPKRVVGKWSIDLWLFSIGGSFDHTFGEDRPPTALPAADPLPPLVEALKQPVNWTSALVGAPSLVSLRQREGVFVHPLARLTVRQGVVPLALKIQRFAGGTVPGTRYDISAPVVGRKSTTTTPVDDQFAAAQFLELSDDEKLARPSFELMLAGVTFAGGDITFGSQSVVSDMDFDRRIDGVTQPGPPPRLSGTLATFAAGFGPAGRSPLREPDRVGQDLAIQAERFVVAGVDDLAPATIAGGSFAAVRQALDGHLATHPDDRLQVVPAFITA